MHGKSPGAPILQNKRVACRTKGILKVTLITFHRHAQRTKLCDVSTHGENIISVKLSIFVSICFLIMNIYYHFFVQNLFCFKYNRKLYFLSYTDALPLLQRMPLRPLLRLPTHFPRLHVRSRMRNPMRKELPVAHNGCLFTCGPTSGTNHV